MNKTIIITGGSSGIGKACVELYGGKGYNVVFTGRDEQKVQAVEKEMKDKNICCLGFSVDATSIEGAQKVIDHTVKIFGGIDVLICNAGVSMRALFEDVDLEVFENVIKVNLMGTVNYVKFALPHLLQSKGTIIGVSSTNGHRGTPGRSAYSASKFAMEGFFESLRVEVKKRGVHIMMISPGYTKTNIRNAALDAHGHNRGESHRDEDKMMTPARVAKYIYDGHQNKKRDIILTALGWWLIFFNKHFPKWMDRTVYNVMSKEDPTLFKD